MADYATESGAQLVARINSKLRPSLTKLYPEIFPNNGPSPNEIIEISGDSNVGKSFFLIELVAKAIIPIDHGGKGATVVLIDLCSNFQFFNFRAVLEKHILHHKMITSTSTDTEDLREATTNVKDIIESALKNLNIMNCYSREELDRALFQLADLLTTNNAISLLAIESLGHFYWSDVKEAAPIRMDTYLGNLLKRIRKLLGDHQVTLAYTKPAYFVKRNDHRSTDKIHYKIELVCANINLSSFESNVYFDGKSFTRKYTISRNGIQWIYTNS